MKKTTCDVDPCNMNFLMEFRDVLLGTWTKIINKSLLSGHYLQSWKKAIIRPLIKSSKLQRELKNYRPISNLSFISKSIEKAALLQFSTFFEDQNLLPTYQSAYRKHHSTETAVLNICDEILENAEHNKLTAMVCLDLSAAFDTVNHSILKSVMEHYFGLKDTAFEMAKFLHLKQTILCENRQQSLACPHHQLFSPTRKHPRSSPLQLLCQYPT